jgi:hypothetical protein
MEIQGSCAGLERPTLDRKETDFFVMQSKTENFGLSPDFDKQSASKALKYFAE